MAGEEFRAYFKDEMDVPSGSIIIQEGRPSQWTFLVLKGQVKVKANTAAGTVTLETLGEGAVIGEMALLEDSLKVVGASVVADGPVRVAVLDREVVLRDFHALSPQLQETLRAVLRRLKEAGDEVKKLAGRPG
ncbi:MAG: cyclic nucleotide-binding domain-containing protein [Thermodesulfobacteriota bacterium]